jgi:hypothetical protein
MTRASVSERRLSDRVIAVLAGVVLAGPEAFEAPARA